MELDYLMAYADDIWRLKLHNHRHKDQQIEYKLGQEFNTSPKTYQVVFAKQDHKARALIVINQEQPLSKNYDD